MCIRDRLGSAVGLDDQLAIGILIPLGQTGEQVADHGGAVDGGVQSGVDGVRLGSQADGDVVGLAGNGAAIEVLVAQRIGEEALDILVQHVQVGVEVQGNDTAGGHQQILGAVHQLEADLVVGAALDGGDQHVIGLSPGAVLDLNIIAQVGQIQVCLLYTSRGV